MSKKVTKPKTKPKTEEMDKSKKLFLFYDIHDNAYIKKWYVAEKIQSADMYQNLVKITQPITEQVVNGPQGVPIKQKTIGQHEYVLVDFFCDDLAFDFNRNNTLPSRAVHADEDIYKAYMNIITARKKQKVEMEARKKMAEIDKQVEAQQ